MYDSLPGRRGSRRQTFAGVNMTETWELIIGIVCVIVFMIMSYCTVFFWIDRRKNWDKRRQERNNRFLASRPYLTPASELLKNRKEPSEIQPPEPWPRPPARVRADEADSMSYMTFKHLYEGNFSCHPPDRMKSKVVLEPKSEFLQKQIITPREKPPPWDLSDMGDNSPIIYQAPGTFRDENGKLFGMPGGNREDGTNIFDPPYATGGIVLPSSKKLHGDLIDLPEMRVTPKAPIIKRLCESSREHVFIMIWTRFNRFENLESYD